MARQAILQISTVPREDFLAIETERYCISHDDWSFEAYHGAAAAAVQEDKGLNRMIYCIVPRRAAQARRRLTLAIPAQQHCPSRRGAICLGTAGNKRRATSGDL